MKKQIKLVVVLLFLAAGNAFAQAGYSGSIKPAIVTASPAFDDYFKATAINKMSKSKGIVVSQFNVNVAEEEYIYLRSGGVKRTIDDAVINLQFKIVNLDKAKVQSAVDELHTYMLEKFKKEGFGVKEYADLKAKPDFAKLTLSDPLNGAYVTDIAAGSRPGFADIASAKFIGFSANNMPSINISGMKGAKLIYMGKDMEADVMNFGLSVHFIEWDGSTKGTAQSREGSLVGKSEVNYKPQLFFGTANTVILPYQKIGNIVYIDQKPFGYSFGSSFVVSTKEGADQSVIENAKFKTIELTIDNDKYKAALVELGKSYIDNIVTALAKSD